MLKAKVVSLNEGWGNDIKQMKESLLKIGDEIEVVSYVVGSFETMIYLRGFVDPFNPVNFKIIWED